MTTRTESLTAHLRRRAADSPPIDAMTRARAFRALRALHQTRCPACNYEWSRYPDESRVCYACTDLIAAERRGESLDRRTAERVRRAREYLIRQGQDIPALLDERWID